MPSPVELIVGPARSGKAGRVLIAYLEAYAAGGAGRCLMLVPTAARRWATESRLLAAQGCGVLVRPQVLTLPDLADRLLTAAGSPVRRISALARRQVVRRCLAALDEKQASVLGPVRTAPGLVDALDALFRELKAARIEPDDFGRGFAGPLRTPRNRLLAHLYAAYQRTLHELDVYDDAGQFWHAAALAAEGRFGPFADLDLLVVDGFQDLAPAQVDMLDALSRRARRTLITLTWEADAARAKLFGVTGRTRQALRDRFGDRLRETTAAALDADDSPQGREKRCVGLPPDLERVRRHLFRLPAAESPATAEGDIRIVRAAGRTREVEEVARQIVDLLRRGAAGPGQIAVIARSLEPYAALVREVFPRYGISLRVERAVRLSECPVVRAAMALLSLQRQDYTYRSVARVLKSNWFRPEAFGVDAETARAAARLARDANVWEGRASYARGFGYLRNQLARAVERGGDPDEDVPSADEAARELAEIDASETFLERLFDATALPESASRADLAERVRTVLHEAGLWDAAPDDPDPLRGARALNALAALEDVLTEVSVLPAAAVSQAADTSEVSLEEFVAELSRGLDIASVPASEPPGAPVVVTDVVQSRALAYRHVFILGLAERQFPRRERRHPFLGESERESLRKAGLPLQPGGHDAENEMLLFYLAATRAGETLTLCYPSLDASGRPVLASHYLDQVSELFAPGPDGEALPLTEAGTRDLALPDERVRCRRELLTQSMWHVWGPGETPEMDVRLSVLDAMAAEADPVRAALAGLAIEWEREHGEAFGPFDGVLVAHDILDALAARFPSQVTMSARRLELFGGCPFAYLAGDLLGLEPIDEPSRDLGPLDVGLIYHGLLERFFGALIASPEVDARLTEETRDAALAMLEETAEAYFAHLEARGRVGSPALWKAQRRKVLRDLADLVDWHVSFRQQADWRPAEVEAVFGGAGGGSAGGAGTDEPLVLATRFGDVRLRGRIDRIDRAVDGEGWQVIDYKSGSSAPTKADTEAGTSFQLPVYLWAGAMLLDLPLGTVPAEAFFLPVRSPGRTGRLYSHKRKGPNEDFERTIQRSRAYIERFVGAMREGRFAVYPRTRGGCRSRCDFGDICRYAEWRINRKWDEHPIEALQVLADDEETAAEEDAA